MSKYSEQNSQLTGLGECLGEYAPERNEVWI